MKKATKTLVLGSVLPVMLALPAAVQAETEASFGGFIKADMMWSDYSAQTRAGNVGDDFLVPSTIAVGPDKGNSGVFDAHAKTSRIWFKTVTKTDAGSIKSYIEADFNASGDERLTNQSAQGLRHAFLDWSYSDTGSILMGQTWGTFFNVGALPEAVDFIGPTSGSLFNRQMQLRWTKKTANGGSIMLAAENPSSDLDDGGSGVSGANFDNSEMPDLVARYNGKAGGLSYSAAVVLRDIAYESSNGALDDSDMGVAFSFSGAYMLGNGDDLKFAVNHGNLGRYIALDAIGDGVIEANGDIDLIDVTGGFVAYRHHWNKQLRSTISYATSTADNSNMAVADLTESVTNAYVNIMYSPIPKLTFGAEYMVAERETESGADGDLTRIQFMGKFVF